MKLPFFAIVVWPSNSMCVFVYVYPVLWGQFSINTSSIFDDFIAIVIAIACANPTRISQNGVIASAVRCDFSSR